MKLFTPKLSFFALLLLPLSLGCGSGPNLPPETAEEEATAAEEEAAQMAAEEAAGEAE